MTGETEQKPKNPTPAKGKQGKAQKPKVKRVRRLGVFSYIFLFLLFLLIFAVTPLYSFILYLVPEQYQLSVLKDIHQSIVLDESGRTLSDPLKYEQNEPLPVLGKKTGVCFSFASTIQEPNADFINSKRLKDAQDGKKIAEIIVIGNNKQEFTLNDTQMEELSNDDDGEKKSTICQLFGSEYPITPRIVEAIYVRPLKPFTPYKVVWTTTRDIYVD